MKALDSEMSALDDRIRASIKLGVDGMSDLLASHTVLEESWRQWLVDEGYDENLNQPWYRSSTLGPDGEKVFDDYKDRERDFESDYARIKSTWDTGEKPAPPVVTKVPPPTPSKPKPGDRSDNSTIFIALGLLGAGLIAMKLIV